MDAFESKFLGTPDVVDVVGVAAIDENIASLERGQDIRDGLVDDRRRHHQPYRSRLLEFFHQIRQRGSSHRIFLYQFFDCSRRHIEDHAIVPISDEPAHHIGAHPAQADHSELHE
jgi:hypothetical protein